MTESTHAPMPNDPLPPDPRLQRRRPSDEELERESEITDTDIDAAIAQFNRDTAGPYRGLLEAEPDDDA